MPATINVTCPNCGNQMRASAEHIGKRGRCPSCKSLVEIAPSAGESHRRLYPATSQPAAGRRSSESTEAKGWLAGLIAVAVTVVLYAAIFFPLGSTHIGALFVKRGPIPYVITLFTCWGAALLVLKYLAVRKQRGYAELELELIPLEIGLQVAPENVDQFLDHLVGLPEEQRQAILTRRIQGALEHFKHRNSVPEVQEYLSSQAELDASGVDSGYTLLRAFIWAIPILGFIGTVMGISDAVSGLARTMPSTEAVAKDKNAAGDAKAAAPAGPARAAADESIGAKMMKGMSLVTDGLATAFDTTLLALVMAIVLLFPTEWLRKTEYRMLDRIEEFANESLLRRMSDEKQSDAESPEMVRDALEAAFQEHQRWLAQWQAQVAELGQVIGAEFEGAVMNVQDRLAESERERLARVNETAELIDKMFSQFGQTTGSWTRATEDVRQNLEASLETAAKLDSAVADSRERLEKMADKQGRLGNGDGVDNDALRDELRSALHDMKAEMQREVRQLTATAQEAVAARAAAESIPSRAEPPPTMATIEPAEPPRRSSLFGFFRRSPKR